MTSCKVDLGTLIKRLRQVPRDAQRIIETAIDTDAKGFIKDIVAITPPSMGKANKESQRRGENAVLSDIWLVYATPAKLYPIIRAYSTPEIAKQYWNILKNHPQRISQWLDLSAPDAVRSMQSGWDEGAAHQKRRARNGRVRGSKPTVRISEAEVPKVLAYIKVQQSHVGMLAAGFKPAADALKVSLPAWIRRHDKNLGSIRIHRALGTYGITITTAAKHGRANDLPRRIQYVLQSEKRKKRLIHRIRAEIRVALRRNKLTP
jgi:hypothetical protein